MKKQHSFFNRRRGKRLWFAKLLIAKCMIPQSRNLEEELIAAQNNEEIEEKSNRLMAHVLSTEITDM